MNLIENCEGKKLKKKLKKKPGQQGRLASTNNIRRRQTHNQQKNDSIGGFEIIIF